MCIFSIIIPVYNRPDEVDELLESLTQQTFTDFEVVVVEDGSTVLCEQVVKEYDGALAIRYFVIENSGPGPARNYGVSQATGRYVIILDSDCILPSSYLKHVDYSFKQYNADAFGGADRAHPAFSVTQKAVNYAMTSFFTTGGIRGSKKKLDKFYPRSFNMGMKKTVYEALEGFSRMRYGEDIDFSIRIFKSGYACFYFPDAWVYHKRRTDLRQFFRQVNHSGKARIDLFIKYPDSLKPVHCLPAIFTIGLIVLLIASIFYLPLLLLPAIYMLMLLVDSWMKNKDLRVALLSVPASFIQLTGYGSGFISAVWSKLILRK
ncbi:MAG: glycosyltransferase [Massilibacteroides sp.]|nr:glycosyltransferase [Massilibacteroides sp.]MDD3062280.1 glycosyltransferase [Massilibacteroides sp.]MDD4113981.1 glycosyltransferase [Massilibacteroides sp.]MDD4660053.1 glycosyltransferase [Massilibacteroides sp.]